jgi:hypothetical protein
MAFEQDALLLSASVVYAFGQCHAEEPDDAVLDYICAYLSDPDAIPDDATAMEFLSSFIDGLATSPQKIQLVEDMCTHGRAAALARSSAPTLVAAATAAAVASEDPDDDKENTEPVRILREIFPMFSVTVIRQALSRNKEDLMETAAYLAVRVDKGAQASSSKGSSSSPAVTASAAPSGSRRRRVRLARAWHDLVGRSVCRQRSFDAVCSVNLYSQILMPPPDGTAAKIFKVCKN